MKFLVDQNLSPLIAAGLREVGHDAVHTIDLGFERAEDTDVLLRAQNEERIVVIGGHRFRRAARRKRFGVSLGHPHPPYRRPLC